MFRAQPLWREVQYILFYVDGPCIRATWQTFPAGHRRPSSSVIADLAVRNHCWAKCEVGLISTLHIARDLAHYWQM